MASIEENQSQQSQAMSELIARTTTSETPICVGINIIGKLVDTIAMLQAVSTVSPSFVQLLL